MSGLLGLNNCRQTKHFFPTSDRRKSAALLGLPRLPFSAMVQLITGHNFLRRHSALIADPDDEVDPLCPRCEEAPESSLHLIAHCPALIPYRMGYFGSAVLHIPLEWSVPKVVSFLREASIDLLTDPTE